MRRLTVIAALSLLVLGLPAPGASGGAFPGTNGMILFDTGSYGEVYAVNPDGTGRVLVRGGEDAAQKMLNNVEMSPNGDKIVANDESFRVVVMNPDGTDLQVIREFGPHPSWSPDGSKIIVEGQFQNSTSSTGFFMMNPDGSGVTEIGEEWCCAPQISPDGTSIAYANPQGLWVSSIAGTNPRNLTATWPGDDEISPVWSPDGTRIAFGADAPGETVPDIHVVGAGATEGGNPTRLTTTHGGDPSWSPDGTKIVYEPIADGIVVMNADGSNPVTLSFNLNEGAPFWAEPCTANCFGPQEPQVHNRTVSLSLRRHLRARGTVSAPTQSTCAGGVQVLIQRKSASGYSTVKRVTTDEFGAFQTTLRDRPGVYRATVNDLRIPETDPEHICQRATSPTVRHRHT